MFLPRNDNATCNLKRNVQSSYALVPDNKRIGSVCHDENQEIVSLCFAGSVLGLRKSRESDYMKLQKKSKEPKKEIGLELEFNWHFNEENQLSAAVEPLIKIVK